MLSVEKITTQKEMGNLISHMNSQGYIFIKEKRRNSDGSIVLEFKKNSDSSNRQMLLG